MVILIPTGRKGIKRTGGSRPRTWGLNMDRHTARKLICGQKCQCGATMWLVAAVPHPIKPAYICHYECQCGDEAEITTKFGPPAQARAGEPPPNGSSIRI